MAQVTIDLKALDSLPHRPSVTLAPHHRPTPTHHRAPVRAEREALPPAKGATAKGAPVGVGATPPAGRLPPSEAAGRAPAPSVAPAVAAAPTAPASAPQTAVTAPNTATPIAPTTTAKRATPAVPPRPAAPAAAATAGVPIAPPPAPALAAVAPLSVPAAPAAGTSRPTTLTVLFHPGDARLTPAETAAITRLVHATPQSDAASFSVLAYAAGSPQNPSAARRLALARALAVHDALRAVGVPGSRIFLRAVGPPTGSGAPDRAELRVSVAAGNTQ